MLQIQDIRKKYITGDLVQTALDGVSLNLRENEFVAILGPSGSGKTTLLNVIGGLDRYDSGDLIINGISTKDYSDRDWDSYRNHTIGFVFQSYNLIPHQTVLANVELALTISGISRAERRRRAIDALRDVGLGNQIHKRPNQMSGGQMQRVAIARALVNNPSILLADEPTGALDSETSVQVMELLKEVSKDRLVVMVTHNPELAEQYANRIVRVKDGRIIDDTNPYTVDDTSAAVHKNMGHSSMSPFTSLALSFNNLRTKKGRTILTAFAGSIGIIGIALILALSTGFQRYIDQIQEDTLSNYPLSIQSETADMTAAFAAFGAAAASGAENDAGIVSEQQMITEMFAQIGSNDLASFKTYLEDNIETVKDDINTIKYGYGIKPLIFAEDTDNGVIQVNPASLFGDLMGSSMMSAYMDSDVFQEMINNRELLDSQYEVLQGRWPEEYNELVMVLSDPHSITDYITYTLGIRDTKGLEEMMQQVMNGEEPKNTAEIMELTYDQLMDLRFVLVPASAKYHYNEEYKVWEDMSDSAVYMKRRIKEGEKLKIVGIVCPKDGVSATALSPGIAYTSALTDRVIENAQNADIVRDQLEHMNVDVFTGQEFGAGQQESQLDFKDMISVDAEKISSAFGGGIDESAIAAMMESYLRNALTSLPMDTAPAEADFKDGLQKLATGMLTQYVAENADPETGAAQISLGDTEGVVAAYLTSAEADSILAELSAKYDLPKESFIEVYQPLLIGMLSGHIISSPDFLPTPPPSGEPEPSAEPQPTEVPLPTPVPELPPESTEPDGETGGTEPVTLAAEEPLEDNNTSIEDLFGDLSDLLPELSIDPNTVKASVSYEDIESIVSTYTTGTLVENTSKAISAQMISGQVRDALINKLSGMGYYLMGSLSGSFTVDEEALAAAFQFDLNEEELTRLMEAMSMGSREQSAESNLRSLGYADKAQPTSISVYLVDFEGKERFMRFIDGYNEEMESAGKEEQIISYTDVTGIMMSSVRTIVDSVSYVLIAFVAVSLIVSSIMIGIITYISVMERTKEIGILRAIGASKRNISQVFNAETFIIGLFSGVIGIGTSLLLLIPINAIIHHVTDMNNITAQLPILSAVILIVLSVILTLIGGLIPSRQAAKKDPVIALRSE